MNPLWIIRSFLIAIIVAWFVLLRLFMKYPEKGLWIFLFISSIFIPAVFIWLFTLNESHF